MLSYIPFSQIIELIAAIAAFIYLKKEKENPWQWFKWFLVFVFVIDFSGYLYRLIQVLNGIKEVKNHIVYKIYLPVEFLFHSWVLFLLTKQYKKLIRYYTAGCFVFFSLFVIELSNVSLNTYLVTSDLFEAFFLLTGCLLYYYYFLKQENHVEIIKFAPFWIVTGLFFYHFVSFSVTVFFDYLALINTTGQGIPLRSYVFIVLNCIFYGSWVYAFKIRRKHLT